MDEIKKPNETGRMVELHLGEHKFSDLAPADQNMILFWPSEGEENFKVIGGIKFKIKIK